MRSNPRYVNSYWDRHGRLRHYFRRRKGAPSIPLPAPGSAEFEQAYAAALQSTEELLDELVRALARQAAERDYASKDGGK
jgi:hypothetical protein